MQREALRQIVGDSGVQRTVAEEVATRYALSAKGRSLADRISDVA